MPTTPNMNLVLPTDHGSADAWDVILDSAFGLAGTGIDGHDHTTGKGVLVPVAGIRVNADKSWSDAGVSRAIIDLKAIDFIAQATAAMTSYAGALFMNSADNELYWHSVAGQNIKLTSGSTPNFLATTSVPGSAAQSITGFVASTTIPGAFTSAVNGQLSIGLTLPIGISGWTWKVYLNKVSSTSFYDARLAQVNMLSGVQTTIGTTQFLPSGTSGFLQMSSGGVTTLADCQYNILLRETGGVSGGADVYFGAVISP